jgi:hypothetical protein
LKNQIIKNFVIFGARSLFATVISVSFIDFDQSDEN